MSVPLFYMFSYDQMNEFDPLIEIDMLFISLVYLHLDLSCLYSQGSIKREGKTASFFFIDLAYSDDNVRHNTSCFFTLQYIRLKITIYGNVIFIRI